MKMLFAMTLLVSALGSTTATAATFDGYQCKGDCSGHQAGYDWAEQNGIDDESSCNTPSASFNQGCESYVEENAASVSDDEEDEEDEDE
jgi:opacity protein-like surface antigen